MWHELPPLWLMFLICIEILCLSVSIIFNMRMVFISALCSEWRPFKQQEEHITRGGFYQG